MSERVWSLKSQFTKDKFGITPLEAVEQSNNSNAVWVGKRKDCIRALITNIRIPQVNSEGRKH